MKTGLFSIIRYVPDPFRKEFVNVGAIVLFPDEGIVEFRVQYGRTKLSALDRGFSPDTISHFEENLMHILGRDSIEITDAPTNRFRVDSTKISSLDKIKKIFRAFTGSQVQLSDFFTSEFSTDKITDEEISYFLSDIISSYVSSRKRLGVVREKSEQSFKEEIATFFSEKDLLKTKRRSDNLIEKNGTIPGLHWTFDFVFPNGSWNLIETLDLEEYPRGKGMNVIGESGKILAKFGAAKLEVPKIGAINPITVVRGTNSADEDALIQVKVLENNSNVYAVNGYSDLKGLLGVMHAHEAMENLLLGE